MSLVLTLLAAACAVDGGYGPPLLGLDYYEPYGIAYGGWHQGYHLAPFGGGARHFAAEGHAGQHFRAAPRSRAMPSIPSRARPGGGGRGGGGRR